MQYFYILSIILLFLFTITWHFIKIKKISERKIKSDYALKKLPSNLSWTKFIIPAIFICAGLYGNVSLFLISMGAVLLISSIVEWALAKKYIYNAFLISGDNLISNDFKIKTFNLQQLTNIDFRPYIDSFQLKFQTGESLLIHRPDFTKEPLNIFINKAIEKNNRVIISSDEAVSKIVTSL